jgi:hypothetical protein
MTNLTELFWLVVLLLLIPGGLGWVVVEAAKSGRAWLKDRRLWVLGFSVALVVGWVTRWDVRVTQYQGMPTVVRVNRWTGTVEIARGRTWLKIERERIPTASEFLDAK